MQTLRPLQPQNLGNQLIYLNNLRKTLKLDKPTKVESLKYSPHFHWGRVWCILFCPSLDFKVFLMVLLWKQQET